MKKRIIAVIVVCLVLISCSKGKSSKKETAAPTAATTATKSTQPTAPETTVPETTVPETTVAETTVPETASAGIRPEFKALMDSYEKFFDEYISIINAYANNPTDMTIMAKYLEYTDKYADMIEQIDALDQDDMNAAELAYYIVVTARIEKKLLTALG